MPVSAVMLGAGIPVQPPTDPHLLHRAFSESDGEAWTQIVREYSPLIRRFAHSIGWYEQHLDDLVQEVLITLLRKRGEFQYDVRGRFRNYLYSVVRFTAFSQGRRIARNGAENGSAAMLESLAREDLALAQSWETQWEDWHRRRAYEEVSRVTNPEHWQIFLDLTVDQLGPTEVAARRNTSVDNVYQIKKRVLEAIRKRIQEQIDGEDLPS